MKNINPKSFYKSSYRRLTHATTMSEVKKLVETIESTRSVVLLMPAGGNDVIKQVIMKKFLKTLKRLLNLLVSLK